MNGEYFQEHYQEQLRLKGHPSTWEAEVRALRAELRAGWQPIETAPEDGTIILAYRAANPVAVHTFIFWDCHEEQWCGRGANDELLLVKYQPTHWMPLPPAPEATHD